MSNDVKTLMEMGFSENRANRALAKTNYKGVQLAMDWIFAHDGDPDIDDAYEAPQGHVLSESTDVEVREAGDGMEMETSDGATAGGDNSQQSAVAKSLKCDECGKLLKSEQDVQAHAARTQHASFSESTDEIKPLTEEEKQEQLAKVQERLKQRRLEKEEEEKKEQIAREKQRRVTGKEIVSIKSKIEEDELKKLAEQRRREKIEEKQARQKVKDQIEKDKRDRAVKFGKAADQPPPSQGVATVTSPAVAQQVAEKKDYNECKLQIRLTNGQALTQTFQAKEPLAAVRLYIEMNRTDGPGPFSLMTSFPRKVFTLEDMEAPLDKLGLVPSAVIIVTRTH